jgi:hypothetical protein
MYCENCGRSADAPLCNECLNTLGGDYEPLNPLPIFRPETLQA